MKRDIYTKINAETEGMNVEEILAYFSAPQSIVRHNTSSHNAKRIERG
jgi:hypothetical protein